ncbi:MAG: ATP synthase F1 subunit delta [Candidatus Omnitrophica bacterium]|nr:ATP synthase F1 subunit delta [Candidatus Omnitrophota bacterium]
MKDLLAARRYAEALFDIAKVTHQDLELKEELKVLSQALKKSKDIERFLSNPFYKNDQKIKALEKFYQKEHNQTYGTLLNFLSVLFEKNRFNLIHEIVEWYQKIVDAHHGMGEAEIRSATPLSADAEKVITSRLERIAGYKVAVKKEVDPSLLGGVRVKIGYKILDGSVRHQIDRLKAELQTVNVI